MKTGDLTLPSFRERFCAARAISHERYGQVVFKESLYRPARILRYALAAVPNYFTPDHQFVLFVGEIRRAREFEQQVKEYFNDPYNRGFLRRTLNLRVSVRRLRRLVDKTLVR